MIKIDYTNYEGERNIYDIRPISIYYDTENPYHGAGFILLATRLDKDAVRSFALKDIHNPEVLVGLPFYFGADHGQSY